jgi:hypothetical protein
MKKGAKKITVIFISLLAILVFSAPSCLAQTASSKDLYTLEELELKKVAAANEGFTSVSKAYSSAEKSTASNTGSTWDSGSSSTEANGSYVSSSLTEFAMSTAAIYASGSRSTTSPDSGTTWNSGSSSTGGDGSYVSSSFTDSIKAAATVYSSGSGSGTSSGVDSISSPSTAVSYTNDYDSSDYSTSYNSANYSADSITSSQAAQDYSYPQGSSAPDNYSSSSILGSALELSQTKIDQFNALPTNSLLNQGTSVDKQILITQNTNSKAVSITTSYINAGQKNSLDYSKQASKDSFGLEQMRALLTNKSNIISNAYDLLTSGKQKKIDNASINDFIVQIAESILSVSFRADKADHKSDSPNSELISNISNKIATKKSNINLKGSDTVDTVDMVAKNSRVKVDIIHKDAELKDEDLEAAMSGMLPMLRNAILMQVRLMIATHKVNLLLPPLANQPNKNDPIEATARAKMSNSGNGKTKNSNSANAQKDKIRLKKARIFELNIYRNLKCAFNYASTGLSPPEEALLPISLSSGTRILPLFILSKEHRAYAQNSYNSQKIIQDLINNRIKDAIYRSCRADLARRGLYSAPPEYGPQIFHITVSGTTVLQPPLEHVAQPVMINRGPQMF